MYVVDEDLSHREEEGSRSVSFLLVRTQRFCTSGNSSNAVKGMNTGGRGGGSTRGSSVAHQVKEADLKKWLRGEAMHWICKKVLKKDEENHIKKKFSKFFFLWQGYYKYFIIFKLYFILYSNTKLCSTGGQPILFVHPRILHQIISKILLCYVILNGE